MMPFASVQGRVRTMASSEVPTVVGPGTASGLRGFHTDISTPRKPRPKAGDGPATTAEVSVRSKSQRWKRLSSQTTRHPCDIMIHGSCAPGDAGGQVTVKETSTALPQVDHKLCTLCGLCVDACSCRAVTLGPDGPIFACAEVALQDAPGGGDDCSCLCEDVCPQAAISSPFEIVLPGS